MGWLNGWYYRKSHTLTGTAAGAQTLYQVGIKVYYGAGTDGIEVVGGITFGKVYCDSKCRTDFGDIRFTRTDEETLLDYWMGKKVDSDYALFWVEVDAIPDSPGTDIIYMYYGKADATTTSNFDNTFIFGDPFDNETLNTNRWPSVDGSPTYTIDTTNHWIQITDMATSEWYTGKGFHSKTFTMPAQWMIEDAYGNADGYVAYLTSTVNELTVRIFSLHHTDYSGEDRGVATENQGDHWAGEANHVVYAGVGGDFDYDDKRSNPYSGNWMQYKISGTITVKENGVQRVSEANSETPDRVHLSICRLTTYGFGLVRFGAFIIRNYASPEPTHTAWGGEEEEGIASPTVTTQDATDIGQGDPP